MHVARRRDAVRVPPWHCTRPTAATWTRHRCLLRCPHSPQRGTGWLEGWRLTSAGRTSAGTVPSRPWSRIRDSRVFVVLYDVSEGDEKALDNWDGVNAWLLPARQGAGGDPGRRRAWPGCTCSTSTRAGLPSARSIGILADSAERAGAPADYVASLRALPCAKMGDSNTAYEGPEGAGGREPRAFCALFRMIANDS